MKEIIPGFVRKGKWPMLGRLDFHLNANFGQGIGNKNHGKHFCYILFVTDSDRRIIVAESFPGDLSELQCLKMSWLYQVIGIHTEDQPDGYKVPAIKCTLTDCRCCGEFYAGVTMDSQVDLNCEMILADIPELHFVQPLPYIFIGKRLALGPLGIRFNRELENKQRIHVKQHIQSIWNNFQILHSPSDVLGKNILRQLQYPFGGIISNPQPKSGYTL